MHKLAYFLIYLSMTKRESFQHQKRSYYDVGVMSRIAKNI